MTFVPDKKINLETDLHIQFLESTFVSLFEGVIVFNGPKKLKKWIIIVIKQSIPIRQPLIRVGYW